MKKAIIFLALILLVGGVTVAFQVLGLWAQIFIGFFPLFVPGFTQTLKDYLASAYFVVGAIIALLSSAGIALSIKEKKILYAIISGIINIISLISLISNFACCH